MENSKNSIRAKGRTFFKRQPLVLPEWKSQLIFWFLAVFGLVVDLWTKSAVFNWLASQKENSVSVIGGFLRLVRTENAGAAFGIATGQSHLLVAVSIIALLVILTAFYFGGRKSVIVNIALAFLTAGVCGNLWDRVFNNGYVRDFIDVYYGKYHWPAFNVADSMLCIGVGLLIISTFLTGRSCQKHAQQQK